MSTTKFSAGQIGTLGSDNIGNEAVGSPQLADHGTHGIDLNADCAGDGANYNTETNKIDAKVDGTFIVIDPATKAITARPSVKYNCLGVFSYFHNGIPYYRSGTANGTFGIGYFPFPGTDAVGNPTKFTFVGQIESTSAGAHYVQIYDMTNAQLISQIQVNTAEYRTLGSFSTTSLANLPAGPAVFAVRYVIVSNGIRIRISSAVLEW